MERDMTAVIDRKRYDTKTATVIASDCYWDGHNWERKGRNTFLYKTPSGAYFKTLLTQWQGEYDSLVPLDKTEAMDLYEQLPEQKVGFEEAFPGETVVEA